jgi:chromosomal replication initiation ATPase DnaA
MDYTAVYNYINNDLGGLLDPAQRAVMFYEVERVRQELIKELRGDVKGWITAVCSAYGTNFVDINTMSREGERPLVRQIIMWGLMVKVVPNTLTLQAIGRLFPSAAKDGVGLDHATVLYAKRTVKNHLDTDHEMRDKLTPVLTCFGWNCEYLPKSRMFHMYRLEPLDVDAA